MLVIKEIKVLSESITIGYYSADGERMVEGSKKMNVGPTAKMADVLRELTAHLGKVFYYDDKGTEFKKSKIVSTGIKIKDVGDDGQGAVITGKLCLGSGKWVGIATDVISFDDNPYDINNMDLACKELVMLCKSLFFSEEAKQLELE